jgi:hypothetical protein
MLWGTLYIKQLFRKFDDCSLVIFDQPLDLAPIGLSLTLNLQTLIELLQPFNFKTFTYTLLLLTSKHLLNFCYP